MAKSGYVTKKPLVVIPAQAVQYFQDRLDARLLRAGMTINSSLILK